jgi:hypothetical protein
MVTAIDLWQACFDFSVILLDCNSVINCYAASGLIAIGVIFGFCCQVILIRITDKLEYCSSV